MFHGAEMPRGRQGAVLRGGAGAAPGTLAGAAVPAPCVAHWKAQTAPSETSARTEGKQTAVSLHCNEACHAVLLWHTLSMMMQGTPRSCTSSSGWVCAPTGGLWLAEGPRSSAYGWFGGEQEWGLLRLGQVKPDRQKPSMYQSLWAPTAEVTPPLTASGGNL